LLFSFIPESLLTKEANHVEGFSAEVAWVETGGHTKLKERLAIRPTSETIMYETYSKWIRSYNDLPLRLNQWANVVRWEFTHCTPFIRSREFLWQEGHTVFATKNEAIKEAHKMLGFYQDLFKEMLAIPLLIGQKSAAEKFAGADFTLSIEAFMPDGKALQAGTSHYLGQNFAKVFDIKFKDKNEKDQLAHQNSWGFSTRSLGAMIMLHSDNKGLVLPPRVAQIQVVIVPLLFKKGRKEVLAATSKLHKKLNTQRIRVHLDNREDQSAGFKYNEWELKGVPIRIELGPRDLENNQVMVVRRDTGDKSSVPLNKDLAKTINITLDKIQDNLFKNAKKLLQNSIVKCTTKKEVINAIQNKKIVLVPWCESTESEKSFKEETGVKPLNAPFKEFQPSMTSKTKCFLTGKKATRWFYFGKSY
jgi:prolyl-tRNA synthetase